MANILEISKSSSHSSRNSNLVDVNCIYEKGSLSDGTPCVVLKTYNPNSQKASISQILHITKETALQLIEIFNRELHL
ncbi:MAG: hypothetical protein K2M44_03290 [Clostridia bacterium]|nr:hypothetical protein [Clostridia bacterium]